MKKEEDGIRNKFLDVVEHVYGIPRSKTEDMTYDQINDLIFEETKRREQAKKKKH